MTAYVYDPENNRPKAVVGGDGIDVTENDSQIILSTVGGGGVAVGGTGTATQLAIWSGTSTIAGYAALATDGSQLQLSVQGSGGGVLIGGDVQIYRSAANVLRTPDSLVVDGTFTLAGFLFSLAAAFSVDPTAAGDGDNLSYDLSSGIWKPKQGVDVLAMEIFS